MPATRLQVFMDALGITPLPLASESGVSRQALLRIRLGLEEPRVGTVAAIVRACRRLSGKAVRAADLFDLGEPGTDPHLLLGVTEARKSLPLPLAEGETRLAALMTAHNLYPAQVATASRLSINRVSSYMNGIDDARLRNVRKLRAGLSLLVGRPVKANEVFDLGEDERDPRLRQLQRRGRSATKRQSH